MSLKGLSLFGIAVMALILVQLIAGGVPATIAILTLFLAVVYHTALARVTSELMVARR